MLTEDDFTRALQAIKMLVKGDQEGSIPIRSLNALYRVGEWFDEYRSKKAAQRVLDKPKKYK
jgi:predicted xylose isomerase-like sugar epimerase